MSVLQESSTNEEQSLARLLESTFWGKPVVDESNEESLSENPQPQNTNEQSIS